MKRVQESLKQSSVKAGENVRKCINQMANLETRVDNSGLDKIGGRIDKIQASFDDRIGQINVRIERKAEQTDIMGIDRRITEQIHDMNRHIEKYAEKEDVVRKLLQLEKQIRKYVE